MHLCKHFFRNSYYFLLYISCLQTIYFVFPGPANNFFSIFFTPPLLPKNNGPSLSTYIQKKSRFDRGGRAQGIGSGRARSIWRCDKIFVRRLVNVGERSRNLVFWLDDDDDDDYSSAQHWRAYELWPAGYNNNQFTPDYRVNLNICPR